MKRKQKTLLTRLKALTPQTRMCKICFKDINEQNYLDFIKKHEICKDCRKELKEKWIKFEIENCKGYAIYEYGEKMQSLLYQFKGCYDYELKGVFLDKYKTILNILYSNYIVIGIPSNIEDDETRDFNHVKEIFSFLKLKRVDALYKSYTYKQSDRSKEDRKEIEKCMKVNKDIDIKGKKILLVDDVVTTGNSLRAAIKLLKPLKPKIIKILTICKVVKTNESDI